MTPQQYQSRRNELVQFLDEAVGFDLPEKFGAELKAIAKKCKEDQFEIALVGEFQGGKSTTFNALCDGRDISPRGLGGGGLKTSATVITAQNISDDATKDGLSEWAEITFKTPYMLSFGLFDCLRGPLLSSKEFRALVAMTDEEFFSEMLRDDGFAALVNFESPQHRECIKKELNALWERWEENRSAVTDEELDLLRIATLQLRYFDTPECRALTSRRVFSINGFQKLVAFPKDWSVRWTQGKRASFTFEECAFVFIDSVLVRLHSRNLARLGCRITDCPGLFANAYDTAVAKRTICNADGVWYLLNGEKQIGEKDLRILRTIKSLGMLEKTKTTFNIRGSHEQKMQDVYPVTKSVLHNAGIDAELIPYNARLAFLATQGDLLCNRPELFSESDRAGMVIDARLKDASLAPAKMWTKMVCRMGAVTDLSDVEDVDGLSAASVETIRTESHFDEILGKVEKGVVSKRSRSILIDKGSTRAKRALLEYEGVLKTVEEAAIAKENEWREKAENAAEQMQEFIERAEETVCRSALMSRKEALAQEMAKELTGVMLDDAFFDDVTANVIRVLETKGKSFYWTPSAMENSIVQTLAPIFGELFSAAISRAVESLKKPGCSQPMAELSRNTENLCDELHKLWLDRHLDSNSFFAGYASPSLTEEEVSAWSEQIVVDLFFNGSAIDTAAHKGYRGLGKVILKDFLFPFVIKTVASIVLGPAVAVIEGGLKIWELTRSEEAKEAVKNEKLKKQVEKLFPKIRPELQKAFNSDDFQNHAAEYFTPKFIDTQDEIVKKINRALEDLSDDFKETRCRKSEEMFRKSAAERLEIAERNKHIRTENIQPLRERIEAFEAQVTKELS